MAGPALTALLALQAQVSSVNAKLDSVLAEQHNASQRRRDMYERLERVDASVEDVRREVTAMKPVVARARAREVFRFALNRCIRRWRMRFVALAIATAALVAWFADVGLKIAKLWRAIFP